MSGRAAATLSLMLVWLAATRTAWCDPERPDRLARPIPAQVLRKLTAPATQPMRMPTAVSADRQGRLFVADGVNNRIVLFTAQGQFAGKIGPDWPGERNGGPQERSAASGDPLSRPVGLAVDASGRLWIADTGRRRLVILAADLTEEGRIDLPAGATGRPCNPTGLAVTADGRRTYVVDNVNHRLLVRDNRTGGWTTLGQAGAGLGQFQWPFAVGLDAEGYAYVSEVIGARVQRVSPLDRWALPIGQWGVQEGQLYRPKGVALAPDGRLFVSDSTLGVVQVFDRSGEYLGTLADGRGVALRFAHPMGLCFDGRDDQGLLYVVELGADDVAVVKLGADSLAAPSAEEKRGDSPLSANGAKRGQSPGGQSPERRNDCALCHLSWVEAFDRPEARPLIAKPDDSLVAAGSTCLGCHDGSLADSRRRVWQAGAAGHRTGVSPPRSMAVPARLPLDGGKITCRTCHTAHFGSPLNPAVGTTATAPTSGPARSRGILFEAGFLRVSNDTGQLCSLCHARIAAGSKAASHPLGPMDRPIPALLTSAGGLAGADGRQLNCQTCHTAHGGRADPLLVADARSDQLCVACHAKRKPGSEPPGPKGRGPAADASPFTAEPGAEADRNSTGLHPIGVPLPAPGQHQAILDMGTRTGPGQTVICLSCHRVHPPADSAAPPTGERFLLADNLSDGRLCIRCHPQAAGVPGSRHDPRRNNKSWPEWIRAGGQAGMAGACSLCHMVHRRPLAQPQSPPEGTLARLDPAGRCVVCHAGEGKAQQGAALPFGHPIETDRRSQGIGIGGLIARPDDKPLGCRSCHDPHRTRFGSFLRAAPDSICADCHADQAARLAGSHDFRAQRGLTNARGRSAGQVGRCGFCHSVHSGDGPTGPPALWAATADPPKDADGLCLACHQPGGLAGKKPPPKFSHPTGPATAAARIPQSRNLGAGQPVQVGAASPPLFDATGRRQADGAVACASCHDAHGDSAKSPALVRTSLGKPGWQLCANCHTRQLLLAGGPHDASAPLPPAADDRESVRPRPLGTGRGVPNPNVSDLGTPSWPAGGNKDLCLSCHQAHGDDPVRRLWAAGIFPAPRQPDALCVSCHKANSWAPPGRTHASGALLHPRPIGKATAARLHKSSLPLVATAPDGPPDTIACKTCHDPHGGVSPARLLRSAGGLANWSVCVTCHADVREIDATPHKPWTSAQRPALICGPCHAVHAVSGSEKEKLWAGGGSPPSSGPPSERYCLTCHAFREAGAQSLSPEAMPADFISRPALVRHPATPPGLIARSAKAAASGSAAAGQVACATCHLAHGRLSAGGPGPAPQAPDSTGPAGRPMLQLNVAGELCASCHGFEALRRFLYYHWPEKRNRTRF